MIRVALLDDYQNVALDCAEWERLPEGVAVEHFTEPMADVDVLAKALAPYQLVMALRERTLFSRELLERLPELRLLATAGMRNAAIDMDAATELGILVCGTEGSGVSTMELTWALILAAMRHVPVEHGNMRAGRWQETVGVGLAGKTLGLVGLGRIGAMMVPVAKAFGMRTIAWSQNLTAEAAAQAGSERVEKDALLAAADVVSIHLKLSERSRGLLGRRELGLMKRTAWLVNTSRGPIVDEAALIEALERGTIAGAGLDVYAVEPLPARHPLRELENVVLLPHIGYVTEEVYAAFYGETLENVQAFLAGQPTRVLNPDVLGRLRPPPAA
ncbi:MAG TPA: D-2-hydroxyacid dehydrogenase family protein [bacterium]|nr:D-2-hydroxyacid dehydrogenase family protein [bacterium]